MPSRMEWAVCENSITAMHSGATANEYMTRCAVLCCCGRGGGYFFTNMASTSPEDMNPSQIGHTGPKVIGFTGAM